MKTIFKASMDVYTPSRRVNVVQMKSGKCRLTFWIGEKQKQYLESPDNQKSALVRVAQNIVNDW